MVSSYIYSFPFLPFIYLSIFLLPPYHNPSALTSSHPHFFPPTSRRCTHSHIHQSTLLPTFCPIFHLQPPPPPTQLPSLNPSIPSSPPPFASDHPTFHPVHTHPLTTPPSFSLSPLIPSFRSVDLLPHTLAMSIPAMVRISVSVNNFNIQIINFFI